MRSNRMKVGFLVGCLGFGLCLSSVTAFATSSNSTKIVQIAKKNKIKEKGNKNQLQAIWNKNLKLTQKNLKEMKSGEILVNLKIGLLTNVDGAKKNVVRAVKGRVLLQTSPLKIKNEVIFSPFLTLPKLVNQSYTEEKEDKLYQYIKIGDKWTTIQVEQGETDGGFTVGEIDNIALCFDDMKHIKVLGKETILGEKVTKVQGVLSNKATKALLDTSGVLSILNFDQNINWNEEQIEPYFNQEKLTFWVTKDNELVKLKGNLTVPVKNIINQVEDNTMNNFSVTKVDIEVSYQNRNKPIDITIPSQVYQSTNQ